MRKNPTHEVELGRITSGPYASSQYSGCQGAYLIVKPSMLKIICSDGTDPEAEDFEHVSVSHPQRTPTWEEMQWIKEQFWEPHEVAYQIHPSEMDYVNCHPYCLHIWRHTKFVIPLPSSGLVGPKRKEKRNG